MGTLGTSLLETASEPPAQIYPDNPNLKSKWAIPPHQMLRFRCGLVTRVDTLTGEVGRLRRPLFRC